MGKREEKIDRQKRMMAIVVTILFVGSIGGFALYGTGSLLSGRTSLPEERILTEPLDLQQKQILLANYGAYVSADLPSCGVQCDSISQFLHTLPEKYYPFVFMYENRASETIFIILEGFNGTKTYNSAENFDFEMFEDELCKQLHPSVTECQARRILTQA